MGNNFNCLLSLSLAPSTTTRQKIFSDFENEKIKLDVISSIKIKLVSNKYGWKLIYFINKNLVLGYN